MRILYFSTDNNKSSGAFRVLVELSKNMIKQGHNVLVILPYVGSGTKLLEKENIPHQLIYTFSWIKHTYFNPWDYFTHFFFAIPNLITEKRIDKMIKEYKPDVAMINTVYSHLGAKICLKNNIPYVWCIKECIRLHSKKTWYNLKEASYLFNNAKKIICNGRWVMAAHSDIINPELMTTIYEGVDVNKFYKKDKKVFKDTKIHFINVGKIRPAKGQYLIIKALNKLKDVDFDLTLVGYYHKQYRLKLLAQCNFKNNIHFTGKVDDVRPFLEQADIFIMPSSKEGFGLVSVEALLAGNYVIGTSGGGTEEIISTVRGLNFKENDYDDLYEKIRYVIDNKESIKSQIKTQQQIAIDNFSSEDNAKKIIKTLEEVINN